MTAEETQLRMATIQSLERIREFDISTLPQEDRLGQSFTFSAVLEPARRLSALFRRLPISVLEDLPSSQLLAVRNQADSVFNHFGQILTFNPLSQDSSQQYQSLITTTTNLYQSVFNALHPFISYSVAKTTDFERLEGEARATLQRIKDESDGLKADLEVSKESAIKVLEEIRTVAAEQGVTQQAIYFKQEADQHDVESEKWRKWTRNMAWAVGIYAALSILIHKIPWISPENVYQTVQLTASKVMIFSVLAFMLYLCAKNFLSHKHNSIVNRHRQNALMTYKAIVEAADKMNQDAVLIHAAACIYSPQTTGYAGNDGSQIQGSRSIIELLAKPLEKL